MREPGLRARGLRRHDGTGAVPVRAADGVHLDVPVALAVVALLTAVPIRHAASRPVARALAA
ncbi:hypothetical protein [Actinomadura harenae]|uniref:hypothetical protein n=1 Tax=Actinomadura harenae TaxID=2483351 RepID=UPI0011C37290|nr:hypothetical protein [Actinomadura harenae]